jgi:fumarate hydratase subunit beta
MIIQTPFTKQISGTLKAGDIVTLNGIIYTGRDAAHKRMVDDLKAGKELAFDLENQIIYYVGPAPAKPGEVIGSAGPTTSYRMDAYAPYLMDRGLIGMIGKGKRSQEVIDSIIKNQGVYFGAIGGAGALLANHIKKAEVIAYEDLGAEAIHRLEVQDFPLTVIIDQWGNNLYETEKIKYRKIDL